MSEEPEIEVSEWKQVSTKKMLSYSLGVSISGWMGTAFAIFVFYYYEVEVGLPVVYLGIAFIIFAIWNMVNDPLLGYLTDKPFRWTKRYGMRFPWIIFGVIPTIVFWFLLFLSPDADPGNPWPVFLYLVIVTCLYDLFYSLYTTHLNASYTMQFRTDAERRRASVINNIIPQILGLTFNLIVPVIYVYGDRSTVIFAEFIIVCILSVCVILLIPGVRESEEMIQRFLQGYENKKRESFFKTMVNAFNQKNFVSLLFVVMLFLTAWNLHLASHIYYTKDILRMPLTIALYTYTASFLGFTLFIPFWANVAKKYGHVKTMKFGALLVAIALTPGMWITTLWETILFQFLGGIAFGGFVIMIGPSTADVNDEFTVTTGRHQEGMLAGIRTFFYRFALIFQAIILTIVHILTAYNPDPNAIQTPLAQIGIRIHLATIPSTLCLIAFFILLRWYDLEEKKKSLIKARMRLLKL
ncbi:MAG: MFS transporter [Promethearchaeota archaeon]|nr:MAG: MFS transporter [Candidatus Lokiarchaeota archaeon]